MENGREPRHQRRLAYLVALPGTVPHARRVLVPRTDALGGARPFVARRGPIHNREHYARLSIRGNPVTLCTLVLHPPRDLPLDGESVSLSADVPSGCALTMLLSIETALIGRRAICSGCSGSQPRSSTPFWDQRFIRVWMACGLPNRRGNPRHSQPCSATYGIAWSTCMFNRLVLPRCIARQCAMRSYGAAVISTREGSSLQSH